ncbi:2057_t:CDS:1, partial [Funneliformis mosseae]
GKDLTSINDDCPTDFDYPTDFECVCPEIKRILVGTNIGSFLSGMLFLAGGFYLHKRLLRLRKRKLFDDHGPNNQVVF